MFVKNKGIRVLHMTPPIINNGVYQYIFNLMKYIDLEKFKFEFLTQNQIGLMGTKEYQKYHFPIRSFATTQRDNQSEFSKVMKEILSGGYDVLELHTSYWRGFMIEQIAMELGIPMVIVHSHSSGLDNNDPLERKKQLEEHERLKEKFDPKYATDFWACSKEAADWLFGDNIPADKIRIIKNAIDVEKYAFNHSVRSKVRTELGLEDCFVIGSIGRLEFQKNYGFLIKTVNALRKYINNVKLLLVGDGELRKELENMTEELSLKENVIFLGWRNDVGKMLHAMDVFALPSFFEGLPLSLVEAQISGLPCVVSSNISREAVFTDHCFFLELNEDEWIDKFIIVLEKMNARSSCVREACNSGFDMKSEAVRIGEYYTKGVMHGRN